MSRVGGLPDEILQLVFKDAEPCHLAHFRRACRTWYNIATHLLFEKIHFIEESQIDTFLAPLADSPCPGLLSVGQLVKEIEFGPYFDGYFQGLRYKKLLIHCSKVEKASVLNFDLEDEFLCFVADASDILKWPLKTLPDCSFNVQQKYRNSLTYLVADERDFEDFRFLQKFPRVQKLDISNSSLNTLKKIETVFDSCPGLQELHAGFSLNSPIKDKRQLILRPSVRRIGVADYDERQKNELDYLLHVCSRLNHLALYTDDSEGRCSKSINAFNNIIAHMYTSTSFGIDLQFGDIQHMFNRSHTITQTHPIYTMLRNYFECIFKPHNRGSIGENCTKIKMDQDLDRIGVMAMLKIRWNKTWGSKSTLEIDLSVKNEINIPLNAYRFLAKFASHINELEVRKQGFDLHEAEEANPLGFLIENYRALNRICLTNQALGTMNQIANRAVEYLAIKDSLVMTQLFSELSTSCINLKSLCLHDNDYNGINKNSVTGQRIRVTTINMFRTSLEILDFNKSNNHGTPTTWFIQVKTCNKNSYYNINSQTKITEKDLSVAGMSGPYNLIVFQCGYDLKEISTHTTPRSCWVVYNNKVYDVTEFLHGHPGGDDLILDYAGKDVTGIMKDIIEHEHSDSAYEILEEYCIGQVTEFFMTNA
ncbi:unnamed protein product [Rhizopus stolonifer]